MKLLNETYLQQRIEELEKLIDDNEFGVETERRIVNELKPLLSHCEEVEVEEIDDNINLYVETDNTLKKTIDSYGDWLKEEGYKLIKTK